VFNTTFSNISAISWQPGLVVEDFGPVLNGLIYVVFHFILVNLE